MSPSTREYLRHILDETTYLLETSKGISKTEFLQNETLKRAYTRSFEIIGEAVKQLPTELRAEYPQTEWRALAGMRDRLIHSYFGIDYDIVWDAMINKIPILNMEIKTILKDKFD